MPDREAKSGGTGAGRRLRALPAGSGEQRRVTRVLVVRHRGELLVVSALRRVDRDARDFMAADDLPAIGELVPEQDAKLDVNGGVDPARDIARPLVPAMSRARNGLPWARAALLHWSLRGYDPVGVTAGDNRGPGQFQPVPGGQPGWAEQVGARRVNRSGLRAGGPGPGPGPGLGPCRDLDARGLTAPVRFKPEAPAGSHEQAVDHLTDGPGPGGLLVVVILAGLGSRRRRRRRATWRPGRPARLFHALGRLIVGEFRYLGSQAELGPVGPAEQPDQIQHLGGHAFIAWHGPQCKAGKAALIGRLRDRFGRRLLVRLHCSGALEGAMPWGMG